MGFQVRNILTTKPKLEQPPEPQAVNIDRVIDNLTAGAPPPNRGKGADTAPSPQRLWTIDGIADNTRITTSFGEVPAQLLRKNDMVRTRDGSFRRIEWINHLRFDEEFLSLHPEAKPVRIRAGALGRNLPERDIELSPSNLVILTTSAGQTAIRAYKLLQRSGVLPIARTMLSYTQLRCEGGETEIRAEGVWIRVSH